MSDIPKQQPACVYHRGPPQEGIQKVGECGLAFTETASIAATVLQPRKGEVSLRVVAATWNPVDTKKALVPGVGRFLAPQGQATGHDVCGEVLGVGPGVAGLAKGDLVFGLPSTGSFCRYTAAAAKNLAKVPAGEAPERHPMYAAMSVAGCTSVQALEPVLTWAEGATVGDRTVCIIGASGGTGLMGVQLAALSPWSHTVLAVCSSKNGDRVLGTVHESVRHKVRVVPYDAEGFQFGPDMAAALEAASAPRSTLDIIYDTVSSKEGDHVYTWEALKTLTPGVGHLSAINGGNRQWVGAFTGTSWLWTSKMYHLIMCDATTARLDLLGSMLQKGLLTVPLQSVGPLTMEECIRCVAALKGRRIFGKIAIAM